MRAGNIRAVDVRAVNGRDGDVRAGNLVLGESLSALVVPKPVTVAVDWAGDGKQTVQW